MAAAKNGKKKKSRGAGAGGGTATEETRTTTHTDTKTTNTAANLLFTTVGCGLCFFKLRQKTRAAFLEGAKTRRKQQFGIDYTTLLLAASSVPPHPNSIRNKISQTPPSTTTATKAGRDSETRTSSRTKSSSSQQVKRGSKPTSMSNTARRRMCLKDAKKDLREMDKAVAECYDSIDRKVEEIEKASQRPSRSSSIARNGKKRNVRRDQSKKLPKRESQRHLQTSSSPGGKRKKKKGSGKAGRPMSAVDLSLTPDEFQGDDVDKWTSCEWNCEEVQFDGNWSSTTTGKVEQIHGKSIKRAVEKFRSYPKLFAAIFYPTEMLSWPEEEQQYTMIYRDGTTGLKPKGVKKRGKVTFMVHHYQPLPSMNQDLLPQKYHDEDTSSMSYQRQKLVTKNRKALLPGRGMGLIDDPTLKIIGEVNPSDIAQGQCGNCWLLSGIASLAEFDGAVRRLFRKTPMLDQMPFVDGRPNIYTVSLWDLKTWKEVDIVVDERLPIRADGTGRLFGAKPSEDGELWVCYLEKALAAHCGGWDLIDGGQCTHAWALLTGCKEQYLIQRSMSDPDKFICTAKFDTELDQWAPHENSPSLGNQATWEAPWPRVGGGGSKPLDEDELFDRMCIWNDSNYLVAASTKGASDENMTDGLVDNHAYSIIDCQNDVCGTGLDLILVRNPWGKGEIDSGRFGSHGRGWREHPEIEEALDPIHDADDGVFWCTKEEFFEYFEAVYLGASDLSKFLLDGMKMSQHSRHRRISSRHSKHNKTMGLSTHSSNHSSDMDSIDSIA
eukprot:CAMPEP_0113464634 /NCGR_PEP_ID=MMETSP0014_2-20120614/13303_1 /TAXON_ID=2857 /ORGANISM="Nitzschia sp." /LENGTH=776 /DNA_ID=CAMNT_0000356723 /DNA_START=84 /DNA_END=2414 /DNA_ORIENTATION=+ /assembly_acc=CAM_ASM_000159